ncbi:hypothetical protein PBI_CONTAGION_92 [Mycobacterium phage Contagion]|uniref:hypothetical protein n=1 Tax=Mycobacterium phage Contagion TaxID=1340833 RepID=UPI0003880776|nr:hypothetical protein PBI_CONTAGION_92 [Mycobacterium phage Contagion]AGT13224.1 hypothetical protein PBI_CONTAGION_92 [Mycobacterium phage Contagion]
MNKQMIQDLRDKLAAERDLHEQNTWGRVAPEAVNLNDEGFATVTCHTAACAAGHTCLMAGDQFLVRDVDYLSFCGAYSVEKVITADGDVRYIDSRARELLGISPFEEDVLFAAHHSHEQTIHLLDQLLADEDIEDYCSENCYDRDDD